MIAFASQPILAFRKGQLIPTDDPARVAVLLEGNVVLSVQPDGQFETRPKTAIGMYEKARKVGDKLIFEPEGQVYVVPIVEGL